MIGDLTGRRICADSNVFVFFGESRADFGPRVGPVLEAADTDRLQSVGSTLWLAEVPMQSMRTDRPDVDEPDEKVLSERTGFTRVAVSVSDQILRQSAAISVHPVLKLLDAVSMATAVSQGCPVVLTEDHRIWTPSGLRLARVSELTP